MEDIRLERSKRETKHPPSSSAKKKKKKKKWNKIPPSLKEWNNGRGAKEGPRRSTTSFFSLCAERERERESGGIYLSIHVFTTLVRSLLSTTILLLLLLNGGRGRLRKKKIWRISPLLFILFYKSHECVCVLYDDNNFIHNWQTTLLAPLSAPPPPKKVYFILLDSQGKRKKVSYSTTGWFLVE